MKQYTLYLKTDKATQFATISGLNDDGTKKEGDQVLNDAAQIIKRYCDANGDKMPYLRMWNTDGNTNLDFGSHTTFFLLSPAVQI